MQTIKCSLWRFIIIIVVLVNCQSTVTCWLCEDESGNMEIGGKEAPSFTRLSFICNNTTNVFLENYSVTKLWIDFFNCSSIPEDLFSNYSNNLETLVLSAPPIFNIEMESFPGNLLRNLGNVSELQLRGFEQVQNIDKLFLSSLINIRCLYFEGFGKLSLTFSQMLNAITGLSGTPLTSVVMNDVQSIKNTDRKLDFNILATANISLTRLVIENSVVTSVHGKLSEIQPSLTTLTLSITSMYDDMLSTLFDANFLMPNLHSIHIYGYPALSVFDLSKFALIKFLIKNKGALNYFNFNSNTACYVTIIILIPKSLRRMSINEIQFSRFADTAKYEPIEPDDQKPLCFDESNQLVYLDISNSVLTYFRIISGFHQLETLNVRNATILYNFVPQHFKEYPKLKHLLLSDNYLGGFIERDTFAELFKYCQKLVVLDLARCNISLIPQNEFCPLTSLKYLNLTGNNIQYADWNLQNCVQLIHLDLSKNKIEKLSDNFISNQLDFLLAKRAIPQNTSSLMIDLSGNPLSCQCNASSFVRWMQSKEQHIFIGYEDYKCLLPNGTSSKLASVDSQRLENQCAFLKGLENNTDCPCDYQQLKLLYDVRYSLTELYCHYPDGNLINMRLLEPNSASKACLKSIGLPTFVTPVVVSASIVVICLITVIFVVVYRRKRPQEFRQILACMNLNRIAGTLMAILNDYKNVPTGENAEELAEEIPFDGFLAFWSDDRNTLNQEVMSKLIDLGLKIVTEDELAVGEQHADILLEITTKCRSMVLILTPEFVRNPWLCEITKQAVVAPCALIPLVYRPLDLDENELLFSNILEKYLPIHWPERTEEREKALQELSERMLGHTLNWAVGSITTSIKELRD